MKYITLFSMASDPIVLDLVLSHNIRGKLSIVRGDKLLFSKCKIILLVYKCLYCDTFYDDFKCVFRIKFGIDILLNQLY